MGKLGNIFLLLTTEKGAISVDYKNYFGCSTPVNGLMKGKMTSSILVGFLSATSGLIHFIIAFFLYYAQKLNEITNKTQSRPL